MTTTGASTATTGNGAGPAVSVDVVAGGPVGVVVGPMDGGDVDSEIGVGSAVGVPTTQSHYSIVQVSC